MVLSLIVMDLVDGNSCVDDRRLDGFLLDDGLNGLWIVSATKDNADAARTNLMNMVVDVLASNDWGHRMALFLAHLSAILELCSLLLKTSGDGFGVAVLVLTVFHRNDVVVMFFWKNFTVVDWLD